MALSRRTLIQSSVVIGGAAALTDLSFSTAAWAVTGQLSPEHTTLATRLVRGAPGAGGYAPVIVQTGEPHTLRTELGGTANDARTTTRTPILAFAHMTDVHLVDAQSPMRLEYVDRFEDKYAPSDPVIGLLSSSYRAHEMLTLQVAEAMVRAINTVKDAAPVSGTPLAFAIQTGDNSDNCQLNEFRWNIDIMDGGKQIVPDSGTKTKYEGVSDNTAINYDTHYWHPDTPPSGKAPDIYKSVFGFPQVPGLLDAARKPFTSEGLKMPWYAAFGNHDGLVQGNFPHTLPLSLISTGALKVTTVTPGVSQADLLKSIMGADASALVNALNLDLPVRLVSPDLNRRQVTRGQVVDEHFKTTGTPKGHGFTAQNQKDNTAYYAFDKGDVRCIVMDTVNPNGYDTGSIDAKQMTWLTTLLAMSKNKYVMVFSHHTSDTMDNGLIATGLDLQDRVLGPEVVALLLANPNVVAWVNGHTHENQIWARTRPDGSGGFWEINTASHIDFPQQSRLIELVDNHDGTLSIFTTMVDHAGPAAYGGVLNNPVALAGLARELAMNDPQQRTSGQEGTPTDRNVELLTPKPALV
ncbi:TIGR03767 family metallophosphoesterase [Aeromicrobium ginsengisoli]|uniref:TIGR03767 family metallophosphoesterase n=1 Tax=Aeromicrobium ginsengisoli TaxID=363867 RepID=A0A5M4FFJ6_9ACTN|nr:TIGR03767 family metallophosphoesterase [Aeromicrobium ginsengisoli]KAA1398072.1 TIGR03767 family metallophosphoesterase [Aeromicrobium ginsengisoli]